MNRREWLVPGSVIATACVIVTATMWPALSVQARGLDDYAYYVENRLVRNPSWSSAGQFLSEVRAPSTVRGYYQPLAMISLMLDVGMGATADDLRVFHRTSLVLHVLNTALVIVLLRMLFGNALIAGMVGTMFGVHPLVVEPLCWVSDRKTLLATCFALTCLVLYVCAARSRSKRWMAAATIAYVLAVMSKPTSVPLPIVMLLLDVWPLRRMSRRAVVEKWPLYAVMAASAVVTVLSQGATSSVNVGIERSVLRAPLLLGYALAFYAQKILWPVQLTSQYATPEPAAMTNPEFGVRVGLAALVAVGLAFSWRRSRAPVVGALIFIVLLLPTTGIVGFTKVLTADKFTYLPMIGLLMLTAAALTGFVNRASNSAGRQRRIVILVAAGLLVVVAEGVAARRQVATWRDSLTYYERMARLSPDMAEPRLSLGVALEEAGRIEEAADSYRAALERSPGSAKACGNLANIYARTGRREAAVKLYEAVLAHEGAYAEVFEVADAYYNLGILRAQGGDRAGAQAAYLAALEREPRHVGAMNNLANLYIVAGQYDKALSLLDAVIRMDPRHINARVNKATVLARTGNPAAALDALEAALRRAPEHEDARFNLGLVYEQLGRPADARNAYEGLLRSNASHAGARARLNAMSGAAAPPASNAP